MDVDDFDMAECATDYSAPCCNGAVYAHFLVSKADKSERLAGFQCAECGKDYDDASDLDEH